MIFQLWNLFHTPASNHIQNHISGNPSESDGKRKRSNEVKLLETLFQAQVVSFPGLLLFQFDHFHYPKAKGQDSNGSHIVFIWTCPEQQLVLMLPCKCSGLKPIEQALQEKVSGSFTGHQLSGVYPLSSWRRARAEAWEQG